MRVATKLTRAHTPTGAEDLEVDFGRSFGYRKCYEGRRNIFSDQEITFLKSFARQSAYGLIQFHLGGQRIVAITLSVLSCMLC